jgi:hypothetical protein
MWREHLELFFPAYLIFDICFRTVCHHPALGFRHRSRRGGFGVCLQSEGMLSARTHVTLSKVIHAFRWSSRSVY